MIKQHKRRILTLLSLYVGVFLFFIIINPEKLSLIFLLVPFGLIFLVLYMTLTLVLDTFFSLQVRSKRIIAFSLSVMPVLLLIIQSITQLTLRDVLLSIGIISIVVWYTTKLNASN